MMGPGYDVKKLGWPQEFRPGEYMPGTLIESGNDIVQPWVYMPIETKEPIEPKGGEGSIPMGTDYRKELFKQGIDPYSVEFVTKDTEFDLKNLGPDSIIQPTEPKSIESEFVTKDKGFDLEKLKNLGPDSIIQPIETKEELIFNGRNLVKEYFWATGGRDLLKDIDNGKVDPKNLEYNPALQPGVYMPIGPAPIAKESHLDNKTNELLGSPKNNLLVQ
ncbi:MAG: hypothetical protein AABY28_03010 [Candidatus Omnitrophota bacterium]